MIDVIQKLNETQHVINFPAGSLSIYAADKFVIGSDVC